MITCKMRLTWIFCEDAKKVFASDSHQILRYLGRREPARYQELEKSLRFEIEDMKVRLPGPHSGGLYRVWSSKGPFLQHRVDFSYTRSLKVGASHCLPTAGQQARSKTSTNHLVSIFHFFGCHCNLGWGVGYDCYVRYRFGVRGSQSCGQDLGEPSSQRCARLQCQTATSQACNPGSQSQKLALLPT